MNAQWKLLAAVAFASACAAAQAQTSPLTGTVNAQLVLTTGCAIDTGSGSVGSTTFGTLDFGTQPSGFTGSLNSQATGGGSTATQVTCSPDVSSVQVTVDGGQNAGKGTGIGAGTRALANGAAYVPYEVYADSAHAKQYVAGTAQAVAVPTPGAAFELPIYGVANKTSSSALAAGTYTDVLNVTLGW
ncbi:spore coat protein U domain-containing protein [Burkholderia pseudomultivorans]|uniref:Spore coat protein n=1 Tax=Burkholderia pseudomultivorans TaxID=1207504 RepID=A0A132EV78_9BURK|nr:spore coat protein U domain-containing protein [Burkholderia pseudomultivorans]KWF08143.1 spore coat protein [Burkholderia pseudomultivorans]KWF59862.1 spore coat protein [Burkholderia pseudomultivorans]MBF5014018.1 spore coat protein U domain-containing protein [Burkholderia pseudomultivorans]MDS0857581.1 spore coat U domain-containing protein [Burkholderia pseudomultivorans]